MTRCITCRLIERKIAALDQAAPLAGWELPDAFATLRRLMEARSGRAGRREYVQVLRLLETFGLDDVHAAVKHALRLGAIGFDAVKHLVLCRVEKRPPRLDLRRLSVPSQGQRRQDLRGELPVPDVPEMRDERAAPDPARTSAQDAEAPDVPSRVREGGAPLGARGPGPCSVPLAPGRA